MTTPRTKLWRPFESDTQRGQEHNLSPQQLQSLEEIFSRATVAVPQCVEHQISRHPNQAAVPFSPVSNPGIALPAVSKSRGCTTMCRASNFKTPQPGRRSILSRV